MLKNKRLILASGSPRRLDLLTQVSVVPDEVYVPSIDETSFKGERPSELVNRLSRSKAEEGAKHFSHAYVLAADTIVAVGRRIMGKPADIQEAKQCLSLLSGRGHRVISGITLINPDGRSSTRVVSTSVRFKRLSIRELNLYLESNEWRGKAGGYAIQGYAGAFVRHISGSYSNIVGLPLFETVNMLTGNGYWQTNHG